MSLILTQESANTISTPQAGKSTLFVNDSSVISIKSPDGNVATLPAVQGSNTQVFFNDDGSINGNANLVFDKTTSTMSVANLSVTGNLNVGATSNLGPVSNVIITGGTANYVLSTDGSGNLSWIASGGGGGNIPANPTLTGLVTFDSGAYGATLPIETPGALFMYDSNVGANVLRWSTAGGGGGEAILPFLAVGEELSFGITIAGIPSNIGPYTLTEITAKVDPDYPFGTPPTLYQMQASPEFPDGTDPGGIYFISRVDAPSKRMLGTEDFPLNASTDLTTVKSSQVIKTQTDYTTNEYIATVASVWQVDGTLLTGDCNFYGRFGIASNRSSTVTLIIQQGVTPYIPSISNAYVNYDSVGVKWKGGIAPTGIANGTDIVTYNIVNINGTYAIYAESTSYKAVP
jgi:hypothetical protein